MESPLGGSRGYHLEISTPSGTEKLGFESGILESQVETFVMEARKQLHYEIEFLENLAGGSA